MLPFLPPCPPPCAIVGKLTSKLWVISDSRVSARYRSSSSGAGSSAMFGQQCERPRLKAGSSSAARTKGDACADAAWASRCVSRKRAICTPDIDGGSVSTTSGAKQKSAPARSNTPARIAARSRTAGCAAQAASQQHWHAVSKSQKKCVMHTYARSHGLLMKFGNQ